MKDLFNLDFSRWEIILLSLIPALINIAIFIYVNFFLQQNRTNFSFSVTALLVGFWQIADGFIKMGYNAETASQWYRLSGGLILFFVSFGMLFTLNFYKWFKGSSKKYGFIMLFLPSIICLLMEIARLDRFTVVKSDHWYWIVNPAPTFITSIIYSWISLGLLFMLAQFWLNYAMAGNNEMKRRQSLLLAISLSVPILGGIISEIIFPLVLGINDVPITSALISVFSITTLLIIKKYNFLDYSPRHQWDIIVQSMNEGILIVDNKGTIMYANKMFCETSEYKPDEIKGKFASELFYDDSDMKQIKSEVEKWKNRKSGYYEIQFQLKAKFGEKIWMQAKVSPYMDRSGKEIGSIGIYTNITERKAEERKIIKANWIYAFAGKINQTIVHMNDEQKLFKEICREAVDLGKFKAAWIGSIDQENKTINLIEKWGMSFEIVKLFCDVPFERNGPQELVLQSGNCYVCNDINKNFNFPKWKSLAKKNGVNSMIVLPVKKSGNVTATLNLYSEEINFFGRGEIMLLEDLAGDISFAFDSLENERLRKQIEIKLIYNEKRLLQTQAIAHLGNFEFDLSTGLYTLSDEACRIYGFAIEENKVKFETLISYVHPEDIDFVQREIKKANDNLTNSTFYYRIRKKDGMVRHINIVRQFEFNSDGTPANVFGVMHDITENKIAEEERTKMTNEIISRNADLEQFTYIVSHNLRSSVANIIGLSDALEDADLPQEMQTEFRKGLSVSAKKLDSVIIDLNNILAVKREMLESKMLISFSSLIDDIKFNVSSMIENQQVKIICDFTEIDEMITLKSYIYSIFYNLITNSIKYRQPNVETVIEVKSRKHKNSIELIFKDNGLGIDLEQYRDKIFSLYQRFHTQIEGKGIGLFMTKIQVETLGGRISVKSKLNEGTEMIMEFRI